MDNSTSSSPTAAMLQMETPANPGNAIALPIFAALSIVAMILPLRDFYRKGNFAACSMIVAVTILNFYTLVNAILWPDDDWEHWWKGEGLCDLEVNTRAMMTTAMYCSMSCFTRNLAGVFNTDNHSFFHSSAMKRRKLMIDIIYCWFLPVLQIALVYTISLGRYSIFPVYGCYNGVDHSWPFVVFYLIPGPIFTLFTAYYAILMIRGLLKYRRNISSALASSGSGMTSRYFVKLSIIALSLLVVYFPVQFYFFYAQLPIPFHAYNFSAIHNPAIWNPVMFFHTWNSPGFQYIGWASISFSFMIFCYFGFNNDAIDTYRSCLAMCGFGMIWPSLKKPRVRPMQGSTERSGFWGRFDLVSKAMKHFDMSRKDSHGTSGTTMVAPSEVTQSCGESQATFPLTHISTTTGESTNAPSFYMHAGADSTPAGPSTLEATPSSSLPLQVPHTIPGSETPPSQPRTKTLFSMFRTNINLPFPPFPNSKHHIPTRHRTSTSSTHSLSPYESNNPDIEAAHHSPTSLNHGLTGTTTNIWSDTQSPCKEMRIVELQNLKKGSRPSRERERRQPSGSQSENCGMRGVVVKKELERRESDAETSSTP
ncbi:uncharacterized protein BP5553_03724 [Venustampulla echinocandica]|uniref:Pheromone a factor receptor n=1 Tax=Venustampulla echinocandica TaxID=2656787 RepID=A0A370TV23_9HELO|nr:uncharacterized protein BP5553_03724 [Venustampulla echinocandica]RDL39384.1 hypothetical protein BP5553_03724 [Venustampulla echinocandica]